MQKNIDILPDVQSFELHPELDREGINQKFLELIQENKQLVLGIIQYGNIPKVIGLASICGIYNTYHSLNQTEGYMMYLLILAYGVGLTFKVVDKKIPIGNYGICILRNSDNTIEFHVSGISEISEQLKKESKEKFEEIGKEIANEEYEELLNVLSQQILRKKFKTKLKEQLIEKITDDIVQLCLQYEVLKEYKIDKIELKSYLLNDEFVQTDFLEVLSKKLTENNIQAQEGFIQKVGESNLGGFRKSSLLGKADGLKNTDRYFAKSSNFFIRMFQIKGGFNFSVNVLSRIGKTIRGGFFYLVPFNDKIKEGKTRLEKTTQYNIDLHKISHKNNT